MSVRLNTAFAVAAASALVLTGCAVGSPAGDPTAPTNEPGAASSPVNPAPELTDAELDTLADAFYGTFGTTAVIGHGNEPQLFDAPDSGIVKLTYEGGTEYAGGFLTAGGLLNAPSFWLGTDVGTFGQAAGQDSPVGFAMTGANNYWTAVFGPVSGLDALPKAGSATPAVPGHPNIVTGLSGGGGYLQFHPTAGDAFSVSYVIEGEETVALDFPAWDGQTSTTVTLPEGLSIVKVTANQPWTRD